MTRLAALVLLLAAAPSNAAETTLVHAGRLVDVRSGRAAEDQAILIEGDTVREVGPWATIRAKASPDAVVIDLTGLTVLPGLIDTHAHLVSSMNPEWPTPTNLLVTVAGTSPAARVLRGAANAREALESGITTVRNIGHSGLDGDAALRDAIDGGLVPGPRMQAATRKITPTGGQAMSLRPEIASAILDLEYLPVSGADAARRAVRDALAAGADVIKVVVDVEPRRLTREELAAVVDEAHRAQVKVAAHATSAVSVADAVEAGVDTVEHANDVTDATLARMREKRVFLGATDWPRAMIRTLFIESRHLPPAQAAEMEAYADTWHEQTADRLARARRAGVALTFASDCWFAYPGRTRGGCSIGVLAGLQEEGVPPAEILRAATVNAAEAMGWEKKVGSVEAGKLADLLAVEGDPLKDVADLLKTAFVMKGGRVVRARTAALGP